MPISGGRWKACAFCIIATLVITFPAHALARDALTNFQARLYETFSAQGMLPIYNPRGEQPGDVYVTPGGAFLGNKAECFPNLVASEAYTLIPAIHDIESFSITGSARASVENVASLTGKYGVQLAADVTLMYGPPEPTTKYFTEEEVKRSLGNGAPNECQQKILAILKSSPSSNMMQAVPWIIEEVWYSPENINYTIEGTVNGQARVELQKDIKGVTGQMGVTLSTVGEGAVVVASGTHSFPVAFRPAFISRKHMQELKDLAARGWFGEVLAYLGIGESNRAALMAIRKDFDDVPRPREIAAEMMQGPAIYFDSRNPEDAQYIRRLDLLFAMSWEIYREP